MPHLNDLTSRQTEVIQLISKGLTNKEVSDLMSISVHTVKAHIASVMRSLEVTNRTEAVFAYQQLINDLKDSSSQPINSEHKAKELTPSVAVLPFLNLSENAGHAHIGESIAEELSIRIASVRNLPVIAFSSCRNYSSNDEVEDVSNKLGALYHVSGSVQWIANTLRVNVELQNVTESTAIWNQIYQEPVDDIFTTLNTITIAIASALNFQLIDDQVARPISATSEAWNLTMQGMHCLHRHTSEDYQQALNHFNAAIVISPEWALPYSGRAHAYYQQWFEQHCNDRGAQLDLIELDTLKAIELDPQLANGHMIFALLQVARGQAAVAVQSLQLALSLNPSLAAAHSLLGQIAAMGGDDENALTHLNHALQLNPRDPGRWSYFAALGVTHLSARRFDQAIIFAGEALSFSPQSSLPYITLMVAHYGLGEVEKAILAKASLLEKMPQFKLTHLYEMLSNAKPEVVEPVFEVLRQLGVE